MTALDYVASKIAEKIGNVAVQFASYSTKKDTVKEEGRSALAKNLNEFLVAEADMEIIGKNDTWVLRCRPCNVYLNNPIASLDMEDKPSGNSLATGMRISAEDRQKHDAGNCAEWRRLKHRMIKHIEGSSKTHINSEKFVEEKLALKNRQRIATRNQLRTAVGFVQSKCAARHYETRI